MGADPVRALPGGGVSDREWDRGKRLQTGGGAAVEGKPGTPRRKPLGCHWAPKHLTPLLALRGRLCSGQWHDTWLGIWQAWRVQVKRQREAG